MKFIKKFLWIYDVTDRALISMLKDIKIFSKFDERKLYELSQKFRLKKYDNDTFIVKEWVQYGRIGLLESWELTVTRTYAWKSMNLWKIIKWEIFWEMAYFTQSLPMADIQCTQNCIVWEVDYSDFTEIMQENPEVFEEIKKTLTQRHKDNLQKIELTKMDQQQQLETDEQWNLQTIKINI